MNLLKNIHNKYKMNIYIENYSEKSFVLRGETQNFKDDIKKIGGKWTTGFTDKKTGEKFAAWLFFINKKSEVEKWINENKSEDIKNISSDVKKIYKDLKKSEDKDDYKNDYKDDYKNNYKNDYKDILNRLLKIENSICEIYKELKNNKKSIEDYEDDLCDSNYKHKRLI